MALKVWDGFDHYKDINDLEARSGFLQYVYAASGPFTLATGRNGFGKCLQLGANGALTAVFGQRVSSAFIGIAIFLGQGTSLAFTFKDTVAVVGQVTVKFHENNFAVEIFRGNDGGTSLYYSPNNVWAPDVWNFLELWPVIDNSAGSVTVRSNGVQIATISGVDTQVSGNAWWDSVTISAQPFVPTAYLDDLYYCDTTSGPGSFPANTFLGDCRVATLFATANSAVTWTPLTGTNYQEINQVTWDGDTTYNYSSNPGDEDLFVFEPLESTITKIYGVQLTGSFKKDDAGMRVINHAVKSSSTEVYSSDHSVPDQFYVYFTDLWILDPNTTANWTLTGVNNILAGYRLIS